MDRTEKLRAMLQRLNFPGGCSIASDMDMDWMWAEPECARFLDWISEHLDEDNIVSPSQKKR